MGPTKSVVSPLEGMGKHAPSVASMKKYADAIGCTLKIEFIPKKCRAAPTLAKQCRASDKMY